ncbi:FtsB family cell division protein [Canibacter zhoujuaniae]|uniref:FtsB family cell division protein n=1 Tax=Canibacter zhoujuaniae TaxID=2708343 RepID=UPI0014214D03|nr:septum formation initiator family protein [Canibacter zhoujuaniae]
MAENRISRWGGYVRDWAASLRFGGMTILLFVIIVSGVLVIGPQVSVYVNQRQEIAQLQQQLTKLKEEQAREQKAFEAWNDPSYVRAEARNRLSYVLPGETQLSVIMDIDLTPTKHHKTEEQLTQAPQSWVTNLLASAVIAGTAKQIDAENAPPDPATDATDPEVDPDTDPAAPTE